MGVWWFEVHGCILEGFSTVIFLLFVDDLDRWEATFVIKCLLSLCIYKGLACSLCTVFIPNSYFVSVLLGFG